MADINKPLMRSQSTHSLNATKTFIETHHQTSKTIINQNTTTVTNNENNNAGNVPKLTDDELSKHNSIGEEIEMRLSSNQFSERNQQKFLSDISQTYESSFERLDKFCEEVRKIQMCKTVEFGHGISLESLDQSFLESMEKLNKV